MKSKSFLSVCVALAGIIAYAPLALAAEQDTLLLPAPRMEGGKPLMEALKDRATARKFSAKKLSDEVMSNLLWAAWGINRPESGKRTAPSAKDKQEIDVYVATADGVYLYDAKAHELKRIVGEDLRAETGGKEPFAGTAAVNFLYVADYAKSAGDSDETKTLYATITTGCIVQNVYLFCASEGLATVVRASTGGPALAEKMGLRADQRVIMSQTIGYPAD